MKARALLLVCGVVSVGVFAGGSAKADWPSDQTSPSGEPMVWMENCPFDAAAPHQLLCQSRSLVSKSFADARAALRTPFTNPPDAGGLDASSAIGTCDGAAPGGGLPFASGLGPSDFIKAYNIPASPTGAGNIVAIVDACGYSRVVADLAAYRSHYNLPALPECGGAAGHAPTPGGPACIGVISQRGGSDLPTPDSGWAGETALDVDMVSAACPDCSILLVQADSPNSWDLGPAVSEAVSLGASAVSNSYGANEDPNDPFGPGYSDGPYVQYYQHPGTLITVSSGDGSYNNQNANPPGTGPSFPSSIPDVLSIGGTNLTANSSARGYTETVWNGATSGCSAEFARPAYQVGLASGSCTARANADISAVANNVSTYVGGGWSPVAGTSCSSPLVATIMTRLGLAGQTNAFFYANHASFYDVTSGNNGSCGNVMCKAGTGWDGPTGWGTPNGVELLGALGDGGLPPVDAGLPIDAGIDAGPPPFDAGIDAGSPIDAGIDAATQPDASAGTDAGMGMDASMPPLDASSPMDATAGNDAGVVPPHDAGSHDAAHVADSAAGADGGDTGSSGSDSGCGCATIGASPLQGVPAGLALFGLGVFVARRRRRR